MMTVQSDHRWKGEREAYKGRKLWTVGKGEGGRKGEGGGEEGYKGEVEGNTNFSNISSFHLSL